MRAREKFTSPVFKAFKKQFDVRVFLEGSGKNVSLCGHPVAFDCEVMTKYSGTVLAGVMLYTKYQNYIAA